MSKESPSWLIWKHRPKSHFTSSRAYLICLNRDCGKCAGRKSKAGDGSSRFMVKVSQQSYPVHRIVYFLSSKIDPFPYEIDHIDRNPLNNCPENLRVATRSCNAMNRSLQSNNKSGFKGVTFCKRTDSWMAQIGIGRKTLFLGRYKNIEDAVLARKVAEKKYHKEFAS